MDNLDIFNGGPVKILNLLMWVGQFGLSVAFPTLFFLFAAVWLQGKFGLGSWIVVVFGILGVLTSVSSAKSCLHSLRKAADEASDHKEPPVSFNNHN